MTLGNPHFAKAFAQRYTRGPLRQKDALIQQRDVSEAVSALAAQTDVELLRTSGGRYLQ